MLGGHSITIDILKDFFYIFKNTEERKQKKHHYFLCFKCTRHRHIYASSSAIQQGFQERRCGGHASWNICTFPFQLLSSGYLRKYTYTVLLFKLFLVILKTKLCIVYACLFPSSPAGLVQGGGEEVERGATSAGGEGICLPSLCVVTVHNSVLKFRHGYMKLFTTQSSKSHRNVTFIRLRPCQLMVEQCCCLFGLEFERVLLWGGSGGCTERSEEG